MSIPKSANYSLKWSFIMKKFARFLVPLLLVLVIISSLCWYLFVYDRDFARDVLLAQARFNDLHGNSRLSSWFYNLAYEHSGRDENVAIELANQYIYDGNYTKAEVTLSNAINNTPTAELYIALCQTYVEQDKLMDAVTMLETISNPEIKAQLDAMRPSAPAANYEPGFYSQYIQVELTSDIGALYCTTNGEYPSIADGAYTEPLTLPAGETTIYAISVADNGLVSEPVIMGYTIAGVIEQVKFSDEVMEAAIREAIGASGSEILFTNELWNITEFTVPQGVQTYLDLNLLPFLKTLTIRDQDMGSLAHLSSLTKLETLDLTGCRFPAEDLAILAKLPMLSNLTLAECSLTTIEALSGAPSLRILNLAGNGVRNLSALSNMTTLTDLNLQHNAVVSLEALSGLANLSRLDVSYNTLTSLSELASCHRLTWIDAKSNSLTDVNGINALPMLEYLRLDYNKIANVSDLSGATSLTELRFSNNQVTDLSALAGLVNLDVLDFSYNLVTALPQWNEGCKLRVIDGSYNEIASLDTLAELDNISYVYMDYNKLTDITALADCYHMVQINVFGNEVKEVGALTDHNIIVNYDPT